MRLIDADALMNEVLERYCRNCDRRKGLKKGKRIILYAIGEAPCRACDRDDMKDDIDNAPTIDAVPVVRCKDCRFHEDEQPGMVYCPNTVGGWVEEDWFCKGGDRKPYTFDEAWENLKNESEESREFFEEAERIAEELMGERKDG